MSGGHVAYHLRPNKAADRHIFVDLLGRFNFAHPLRTYEYVGFGGPFLEDFRLLHSQFGISRMVSIEMDEDVLARQRFNQPYNCIRLEHATSGNFLATYSPQGNCIVWLDYASPRELRKQLGEFQLLLSKLGPRDIVKLTINATPDAVAPVRQPDDERWDADRVRSERFETLRGQIGDYLPNNASPVDMTARRLPGLLYRAVEYAFRTAARSGGPPFVPLAAFHYADSRHTMLTVMGALIPDEESEEFFQSTGLKDWELAFQGSVGPIKIDLPSLSTRERLFIDQRLPTMAPAEVEGALGFLCGEDEDASREMIAAYARFYRHYPYFSRIVP
jgi:hypothetical protein